MTAEKTVPELIELHKIARVISWSRKRTLKTFRDLGIAEKLGDRWVVTRDDLRERCPRVYRVIVKRLEAAA